MTRWKKDETKFNVKLQYHDTRGCMVIVPKPILEELNEPKTIVFEIKKNGSISVNKAD
ncbi:MAG: hypothetical protein R1F52_00790 [Candidatus Nitrosoabyssus spongiisocia]|nr:MAG: hypothetical protein R1F52_00790 [Nitrosopumilaceae archaeon AB1(1)]